MLWHQLPQFCYLCLAIVFGQGVKPCSTSTLRRQRRFPTFTPNPGARAAPLAAPTALASISTPALRDWNPRRWKVPGGTQIPDKPQQITCPSPVCWGWARGEPHRAQERGLIGRGSAGTPQSSLAAPQPRDHPEPLPPNPFTRGKSSSLLVTPPAENCCIAQQRCSKNNNFILKQQ